MAVEVEEEKKTYIPLSQEDINCIFREHALWLKSKGQEGQRACFSGYCLPEGTKVNSAVFHDVDFSGASLAGTTFINCKFSMCDFTECDLRGTVVDNCQIMNECKLQDVAMEDALFTGRTLIYSSDFRPKSSDRACLQDVIFERVTMDKACLDGIEFFKTAIRNSNMQGVHMEYCHFHDGCTIDHTPMDKVSAHLVVMGDTAFIACSMRDMKLMGCNFNGSTLEYVDMAGADIGLTNFEHAAFKHSEMPCNMVVVTANLPVAGEAKSFACNLDRGSVTSEDVFGQFHEPFLRDIKGAMEKHKLIENFDERDCFVISATLESLKAYTKSFSANNTPTVKEKLHAILHH